MSQFGILFSLLMLMMGLWQTHADLTFEGCYSGVMQHQGESSFRQLNDNGACVEECRGKGFILAATRNRECHCSQSFPMEKIASAGSRFASGRGSVCNILCPGAIEDTLCRGDECCGGTTGDGKKAYSVYAVGGIDIPSQVSKRLQRNLFGLVDSVRYRSKMALLWDLISESPEDCGIFESFPDKVLSRQNNMKAARTVARCERYCDQEQSFACLAYSFTSVSYGGQTYLGECRLYDHLTPLKRHTQGQTEKTTVYIRRCVLDRTDGNSAKAGPPTVLHNGGEVNAAGIEGFLTSRRRPITSSSWAQVCMTDSATNNNLVAKIGCQQMGFHGGYAWPYRTEKTEPSMAKKGELQCRDSARTLQDCAWRERSMCERGTMLVYCIGRGPKMINKRLSLELKKYKRQLEEQLPLSTNPMETHDLELDNTDSNQMQEQSYRKDSDESNTMMYRTETGFQEAKSETQSSSSTSTWSAGVSTAIGTSITVGASAGGGFGGIFSASVETQVTTSFRAEISHVQSGRSTDAQSSTKGTRNIFSKGYSNYVTTDRRVSRTYSMVVPPFHKGFMNFFMEKTPMTLKWRSEFGLEGDIELQYGPVRKNISVVRLFTNDQRQYFTLGSLEFTATKLVSKITIKNSDGNTVKNPNGPKCSQPQCKRWYGAANLCDGQLCVDFSLPCPVNMNECLQEYSELSCQQ